MRACVRVSEHVRVRVCGALTNVGVRAMPVFFVGGLSIYSALPNLSLPLSLSLSVSVSLLDFALFLAPWVSLPLALSFCVSLVAVVIER